MARNKFLRTEPVYSLLHYYEKEILIIPKVQRDLVWQKSQKQLLIDSLVKDYDIPKLYFRDIGKLNGDSAFEIVDGQQRINAIHGFFNDQFPLPDYSDPYAGEEIHGKFYSELSIDLQVELKARNLDIVHLVDYSDAEMEETFLRLQNGTPLRGPEKRRAIPGNMKSVVETLAQHSFFSSYCGFSNNHFAYEDVVAKALCILLHGEPCSINFNSLKKMYETNPRIQLSDCAPSELKKAYNFLEKAFKKAGNPRAKKYVALDLPVIVSGLLKTYDLGNHEQEFGQAYLDFHDEYTANGELEEESQDPKLAAYANAARGDSLEFLKYRQGLLKDYLVEKMPDLRTKDPKRDFTAEQRMAIYRRDKGICQHCGKLCDEDGFHADHITPHANGGLTQISNGQVLCPECNWAKGKSAEV